MLNSCNQSSCVTLEDRVSRESWVLDLIRYSLLCGVYTVEPPNNGHRGTSDSVIFSEVFLSSEIKMCTGKFKVYPLFRLSIIRHSFIHTTLNRSQRSIE